MTAILTAIAILASGTLGPIAYTAATRRRESNRNPGRHRLIPRHAASTPRPGR